MQTDILDIQLNIMEKLLTAYGESMAIQTTLAYKQGIKDCVRLLKEMSII